MDEVAVVVNQGSGAGHAQATPEALRALFAARGLRARIHVHAPGGDFERLLDAAMAGPPAALVAAGGDGTVNAVAARAIAAGLPLGVLPTGTLNHFARDLGLGEDLEAAVAAIASGRTRAVDVATVNDRIFLNNASIGLYASVVLDRERQQRRLGRGKWTALLRATWAALREPRPFAATLCMDGGELCRETPFVFVGNNAYVVQGPAAGERPRMDDGRLSVYVLHARSGWGLLWLAVRTLVRGVSGARDLDAFEATTLAVDAGAARVDVARDGEVEAMDTPVRFASRPRALAVFAPPGDAG